MDGVRSGRSVLEGRSGWQCTRRHGQRTGLRPGPVHRSQLLHNGFARQPVCRRHQRRPGHKNGGGGELTPLLRGVAAGRPVSGEEPCREYTACCKKEDVLREAQTVNCLVLDARPSAWFRWKATDSLVRPSPRSRDFFISPPARSTSLQTKGGVIV